MLQYTLQAVDNEFTCFYTIETLGILTFMGRLLLSISIFFCDNEHDAANAVDVSLTCIKP